MAKRRRDAVEGGSGCTLFVVQHVGVRWTKASRGGAGAKRRNAVPEVAPLPPVPALPSEGDCWVRHDQFWSEGPITTGKPAFQVPKERLVVEERREIYTGAVTLTPVPGANRLVVTYRYALRECGAPFRYFGPATFQATMEDGGAGQYSREAAAGEWVQIVYNGRFVPDWEGDWWYEKHAINAGVFTAADRRTFLRNPPTHRYDASALLI